MCDLLRMAFVASTDKIMREVCKWLVSAKPGDAARVAERLRSSCRSDLDIATMRHTLREVANRL
jgi:hypothetical protein